MDDSGSDAQALSSLTTSWSFGSGRSAASRSNSGRAREELERRYLGGRPALLADADEAWSRFADLVDGLWGIAEAHVETSAEEAERAEAVGGPLFDQRLAERVKWLADDARVATFERLGENLRAAAIMERRLTGVA
jgi:hypothetical protein